MVEQQYDSASLFEALSHPTRIKILRLIHEKPRSFADLKHELAIASSGHLQHHLAKLTGLVVDDGRYVLTVPGLGALKLAEDSERPMASLESLCRIQEISDNESLHIPNGSVAKQHFDFCGALGFRLHRELTTMGESVFIVPRNPPFCFRIYTEKTSFLNRGQVSVSVLTEHLDRVFSLAKRHRVEVVAPSNEPKPMERSFYVKDDTGRLIQFQQAAGA